MCATTTHATVATAALVANISVDAVIASALAQPPATGEGRAVGGVGTATMCAWKPAG